MASPGHDLSHVSEARRPNAMVEHSAEGKYRRRAPPSGEASQARGAYRQGRLYAAALHHHTA